jgi:hypothetical protein
MERGRPRIFATEQAFKDKFDEYIDFCIKNDKLANIAGFCVFADVDRETYYNQKIYYPNTFKKTQEVLEDYTINAKINDTFKIFYMKNKFNYRDRQEIDQNINANVNSYKELSVEELKKLAGE